MSVQNDSVWVGKRQSEKLFFYIKFNFTKPKALQLEQKTNKKPFIENQKPNRAVLGQTSHELTETV